ncbi:MAG: FAD-dependent oxidoreductase [Planctomycetota bacterium]
MRSALTVLVVCWCVLGPFRRATSEDPIQSSADVIIYGGTSAAVIAAVQVKKMGKSVVIVCPDVHLGGLSSGGLGWTDTGKKEVIGGLARDFYHRIFLAYQESEAWKWQTRESYGNRGQGNPAIDGKNRTQWIFEPHVAESVFEDYCSEFEIPVYRDEWLDRDSGVEVTSGMIRSIRMLSGRTFRAKVFLDATYEGDLLAAAGVSYMVGRESNEAYEETWNGVQTGVYHHSHHFGNLPPISAYVTPGDPQSGVLPRVSAEPPGEKGEADDRVQAYCFRMCLTNHPENRVPFSKPEGYDPQQYELMARIYEAGWKDTFRKFDPIPNRKTDTNNHGPMSTDNIGFNYDYPEASYERRREIIREHENYQKGWLYFHVSDPRVPEAIRKEMQIWGLAADEFTDNGHWPHQIYVREARRMSGEFVMTQNELQKDRPTPRSIGMGSYSIDSHNVQRHIDENGHVQNEGDIGVSTRGPYQISYGSLVPKREECTNLLVPVCVSSTHIAFGSIRMEPVFMILGQSAATAAVMAIENDQPVQSVDYDLLKERLLKDGQVLEYESRSERALGLATFSGLMVDDTETHRTGTWVHSQANHPHFGTGYLHDDNRGKGDREVRFDFQISKAGQYEVQFAFPPNGNRATNVPVRVSYAGGSEEQLVDQRAARKGDLPFHLLGRFQFQQGDKVSVSVSNDGTDGYVVVDAIRVVEVDAKP